MYWTCFSFECMSTFSTLYDLWNGVPLLKIWVWKKKHSSVLNCPISFSWCSAPICEEDTVTFHLPFSCHSQSCRSLSNSPSVDSTPGWRVSNFLHHMEAAPETWSPLSLYTYSLWNGSMRITHSTEEAEKTRSLHRVMFPNLSSMYFVIIPNSAYVCFFLTNSPEVNGVGNYSTSVIWHCAQLSPQQLPTLVMSHCDTSGSFKRHCLLFVIFNCPAKFSRHDFHIKHDIKHFYLSKDELSTSSLSILCRKNKSRSSHKSLARVKFAVT